MRISDWSSDVCSSDLAALAGAEASVRARALDMSFTQVRAPIGGRISDRRVDAGNLVAGGEGAQATLLTTDRKSVVEGKSVSGRVDLGGRRYHKKQHITEHIIQKDRPITTKQRT